MKVAVIGGTGYVGLVTGIGLARLGHSVTCADIDGLAIELLSAGRAPIREKGLEAYLAEAAGHRRLSFTVDVAGAAEEADVIMLAVGSPAGKNGRTDLSQIMVAADALALALSRSARAGSGKRRYKVIAVKSTVPVGTCDALRDRIRAAAPEASGDFDVVSNPEFLREGSAMRDFLEPDRIVVGARRRRAVAAMRRLYRGLDAPFLAMDPRSAEMVKYASNAFLAARISFINEIAGISESVGADVRRVAEGMGLDRRIGRSYLEPGLGFGGPCLGKDMRSLIAFGGDAGARVSLLDAVLDGNAAQMDAALRALGELTGGLTGKRIALLGLSFKAGTADTRDSPAMALAWRLAAEGAAVTAWDPILSSSAEGLLAFAFLKESPEEAARGAHCLVALSEDAMLGRAELRGLAAVMKSPAIYDVRRLVDARTATEAGFAYRALGVAAGASTGRGSSLGAKVRLPLAAAIVP